MAGSPRLRGPLGGGEKRRPRRTDDAGHPHLCHLSDNRASRLTAARTLESCAGDDRLVTAGSGTTRLFLYPGRELRIVDALLTNFHLPESTLLMLVSAFAGTGLIRQAYVHAVAQRYRFFSYGDAMYISARAKRDSA